MNVVTAVRSPTERESGGGPGAQVAGQLFWVRPLGGGLKGRKRRKTRVLSFSTEPSASSC